jgi:hypothetical protein
MRVVNFSIKTKYKVRTSIKYEKLERPISSSGLMMMMMKKL